MSESTHMINVEFRLTTEIDTSKEYFKDGFTVLTPRPNSELNLEGAIQIQYRQNCEHKEWGYKILHDHRAADCCTKCGRIILQDKEKTVYKEGFEWATSDNIDKDLVAALQVEDCNDSKKCEEHDPSKVCAGACQRKLEAQAVIETYGVKGGLIGKISVMDTSRLFQEKKGANLRKAACVSMTKEDQEQLIETLSMAREMLIVSGQYRDGSVGLIPIDNELKKHGIEIPKQKEKKPMTIDNEAAEIAYHHKKEEGQEAVCRYLPVEGELVLPACKIFYNGVLGEYINGTFWNGVDGIEPQDFDEESIETWKLAKPFAVTQDGIEVGDEFIEIGCDEKRVAATWEQAKAASTNSGMVKVLGELSPNAIWVKDGKDIVVKPKIVIDLSCDNHERIAYYEVACPTCPSWH